MAGAEPTVSLQSFMWAHCLVRSRALQLSLPATPAPAPAHQAAVAPDDDTPHQMGPGSSHQAEQAPSLEAAGSGGLLPDPQEALERLPRQLRCMLPGIDFCNHADGGAASCRLHLSFSSRGQPL